ncbi:MAG TPA: PTS sugar transporter subunit IIA [Phycisphaerae bacterium]|nr:PTS sugar transporter subunit IIA [Phycisphaerae bacterium]HOI55819.1 PTS sugar transporter subunit IIA [Phycisphaerae bacterium]
MRLRDLLDSSTVKVSMVSTEKDEAIEELVDVLVRSGRITDREGVIDAIMNRERQQTTGIGSGVAVPHAKHESITELTAALGISKSGIEFDAIDDKPVRVVFLIMARVDDPGPHIQALAEIARLLQIPGFYRKMTEAESVADLLALIESEE